MQGTNYEAQAPPSDRRPAAWARLDEMLQELPQEIPILPPEDAGSFSKYRHPPPHIYSKDEAWQKCAIALETHDIALCKGYREEMDTLLVFAGLFSAVVTAFSVESYQWLKDDSSDAMVVLLSQIARSVAQDDTTPAQPQIAPGMPRGVSIRINCYWFLSLSISLPAALIAILCKQWIREFESHAGLAPKDFVGFRQVKFEGLQNWNVGGIISALPVLLQLSLAIFAFGILELLFQLHPAVAAVVCIPTLLAVFFYAATTLLPAAQFAKCRWNSKWWQQRSQCPYHSPQAFLLFRAYQRYEPTLIRVRESIRRAFCTLFHLCLSPSDTEIPYSAPYSPTPIRTPIYSWNRLNSYMQSYADHIWASSGSASRFRGLAWLGDHIGHSDVREWIWNCIWEHATGHDSPYSTDWLRRGLIHVLGSAALMAPQDPLDMSPRSLALLYLLITRLSPAFITEVLVQNLRFLELPVATRFLDEILNYTRGDTDVAIAAMHAVSQYSPQHVSEDIGVMLRAVTHIILASTDLPTRMTLRACAARLILNWLDARNAPPWASLGSARWMLSDIVRSLQHEDEDFLRHPERLRGMRHIEDLATLVRRCIEMSGQPIAWPMPSSVLHIGSDSIVSFIGMEPIVLELLRISVFGINGSSCDMRAAFDPDVSDKTDIHGQIPDPANFTNPGPSMA